MYPKPLQTFFVISRPQIPTVYISLQFIGIDDYDYAEDNVIAKDNIIAKGNVITKCSGHSVEKRECNIQSCPGKL